MTNDELKIIVAEQSNNIISESNINLLSHDDLIRLICLMINVQALDFSFQTIEENIPPEKLIEYLNIKNKAGIDEGLKFAGLFMNINDIVKDDCPDYKDIINYYLKKL
jgi:hypothetical protein